MKFVYGIFAVIILAVMFSSLSSASLIDDLRGYFAFNESSGINSTDIVRNFNISINGAGNNWKPGKIGNSIQLNTSFTGFPPPNTRIKTNSTALTLNFWFNKTSATDTDGILANKDSASAPTNGQFRLVGGGGTNSTWEAANFIALDYMNSSGTRITPLLPVNFTVGKYYMLTMIFNSSAFTLYVDGVQNVTYNNGMGTFFNGNITLFDDSGDGSDPGRNYQMDELGIWSRSLNSTEVTSLYNSALGSTYPFGIFVIENQTFYNPITLQGQEETFITNITLLTSFSFTNYLIWNNTQYNGNTIALGGNNYQLIKNITIPLNVTGNITWFWRLNFSNGNQQNLSSHIQEVRALSIDNCTSFTNEILNFTLYDEDLRTTRINGTIEVAVNLWNSLRTGIVKTYNNSYFVTNLTTARVCIDNVNSTLSMDYQAKYYSNSSYSIEYKFAQAISITNTTSTQNINLYDLLDARSTAFTITLDSPDLSAIQGAVIDVQRQYLPINQFISVESPLTNNIGEAVAHLVHNEVYYNFVVTRNGTLLGTFNNYLVQCQNFVTGDCRISLNLIQSTPTIPNFQTYGNITGAFTWSPASRNLLFSFVSTDGLAHNVSWNVLKLDSWGNTTICTTFAVATTGTFSCTIPITYGNSSIQTQLYSDGIFLGNNIFSLQPSPGSVFGGTRVVLAIVMYSTLTLMMIASPVTIIIGSVLGMMFAGLFHLVDGGSFIGNASILLWFLIAAGVIVFYMRNKT